MKDVKNRGLNVFLNGMLRGNPALTMALGIGPAIFMTYDAATALYMGLLTTLALVVSCMLMSALKRVLPRQVRIPCHMLMAVGAITLIQFMLNAYFPMVESRANMYFLPVVLSSLVFGRAQGYALRHSVSDSGLDALGVGIGYTFFLVIIACLREMLGNGTLFGNAVFGGLIRPVSLFSMAPGVLFLAGCLSALVKRMTRGGGGR
ncbi:MAG TPA: Rnf-Nqr domain containing protein [Bacillota bacterium]|nr:Rnf-Nqr domain containing protein [Bacillota bacterium]